MSSVDWVPELAAALNKLVPVDNSSRANWDDVEARLGRSRRSVRRGQRPRGFRLAIVIALLFLLLAGTATAMYFVLRSSPQGLIFSRTRDSSFAVLDDRGRPHPLWRCPRSWFCREVGGAALSPDGKRLAISFDALTLAAPNLGGIHVVDLETGADRQIPALRVRGATRGEGPRSLTLRQQRTFGCSYPKYLSWSPDGSRLAYTCEESRALIYTIRPDGSGRRLVPTSTRDAYAPTWSPDGRRIAFSTCRYAVIHGHSRLGGTSCRSSLYLVDLDGRHERRLATGAFPDWSPSGRTIAYVAPGCGSSGPSGWRIRLVTPTGRDATPGQSGCGGVGPPGSVAPAWSPDGGRLAITSLKALYVMNADGGGLERILRGNFLGYGVGGLLRPFWQPPKKQK